MEIESDHKPLETILKKPLHQAPTENDNDDPKISDIRKIPTWERATCSRYSAYLPEEATDICPEEFEVNVILSLPISESKIETFKLRRTIEKGWPNNKSELAPIISPYWNYRDEISTCSGILFKGEKVIVPRSMQHEMLKLIHSSHLGIEGGPVIFCTGQG